MNDPLASALWPKIDRIMTAVAYLHGAPIGLVPGYLSQEQISAIRAHWRDLGGAWLCAHNEYHLGPVEAHVPTVCQDCFGTGMGAIADMVCGTCRGTKVAP